MAVAIQSRNNTKSKKLMQTALATKAETTVWQYKAFNIRLIDRRDNLAMASIIRTVMPEFGADGPGFAIHDAEVDAMFEAYQGSKAAYYVVEKEGVVVGGAGFAPLAGGDADVCELKKMYFLKSARGQGLGQHIVPELAKMAKTAGYAKMYIETLDGMDAAISLYNKLGAEKLCSPLGSTGHFGCNNFFLLKL